VGARETEAAALGTLGAALMFLNFDQGVKRLEQALAMAVTEGLHWVAANSYVNLGSAAGELLHLPEATRWLRQGLAFAEQHEVDFYRHYALAWLALCALHLGDWDDAAALAAQALASAGRTTTSRVMALVALGRLRLRRGDPGVDDALDEALDLAQRSGTLQRLAPVCAARAEAAWLRGDLARAAAEARTALPLALARQHAGFIAELRFWLWRAGEPEVGVSPDAAFDLQASGHWQAAAAAWAKLGCPHEQAWALADGDTAAQQQALAMFERLGARPAAERLRRQLREAGVKGVERGARASTQAHPAGLTAAEAQVLSLMAQALRNADIAKQLHRSVRTVDHHVASVLAKLGCTSRQEAVLRAEREGWVPAAQSGQGPNPK
jgi:DNA-binding CsgD family transcriptional regulator